MEIKSSADWVRMTRAALAAAGFVRHEVDGTVYWECHPERSEGSPAVNEGRSFAVSAAQDDTFVLVHGVNDQAGTWFTVAPALARNARVIIPDLPGHGESDPQEGPLPISMMVKRLRAVLGDERVTLLGNSLGGWIAILYTLAYPESVTHLILEASGGLARPFASPVIARDRDEAMLILRNVHGPQFEPSPWIVDTLLMRATGSPMLRVTETAEHAVEARLHEIRVPTALVWGADDGVLPLSYARALQEGIANSTLHVIEGAAHIPHMQQPERFLACLTSIS